jgi:hypothetical protein
MLRSYFAVEPTDDEAAIRDKVAGRLLALGEADPDVLSPVLSLLDVPVHEASWARREPRERRALTIDAVKRLFPSGERRAAPAAGVRGSALDSTARRKRCWTRSSIVCPRRASSCSPPSARSTSTSGDESVVSAAPYHSAGPRARDGRCSSVSSVAIPGSGRSSAC